MIVNTLLSCCMDSIKETNVIVESIENGVILNGKIGDIITRDDILSKHLVCYNILNKCLYILID